MRQLVPVPIDDIDVERCYLDDVREPTGRGPWLVVNMATSIDGATAIDGRSGGIGGGGDRLAFHALRSAADVILVGAGTVRSEKYGQVRVPEAHQAHRRAAGRTAAARIAVVTASCSLDPSSRLFTEPGPRPLIYTVEKAPEAQIEGVARVADVVIAGAERVDCSAVLDDLANRSARCVVCEGGPSLNGDLIAADAVDEWCWTIGPVAAGGPSKRAAVGSVPRSPVAFRLDRLLCDDRDLLARYVAER